MVTTSVALLHAIIIIQKWRDYVEMRRRYQFIAKSWCLIRLVTRLKKYVESSLLIRKTS